jgi:hypothetical protein
MLQMNYSMLLNIFYKVKLDRQNVNGEIISFVVKHANVNQIIGANENATYPNITLREDVSLLDLAVGGSLNCTFLLRQ